MAALATAKPPARSARTRRPAVHVEQPPRTILRDGERVDISGLTGDALFEAIVKDEEQWDYERLAAEAGRSRARVRVWVSNAYATEQTGKAADDKTFEKPDGVIGGSPWWYAGHARHVLHQIGVMDRAGRAVPYKPTGRAPGAKDLAPRKRWAHAPMRDTAADVYREYVALTTRKRDPLTDQEARAELLGRHNLTDSQLTRLVKDGGNPGKKWKNAQERDAAFAVYREYMELTTHKRDPISDRQARAELCRRHTLTRTQLARRIKEGQQQVAAKKGKPVQQVEVDAAALRARLAELVAEQRAAGYSERGAHDRARAALAEEAGLTRRQIAGYIAAAEATADVGAGG